MNEKTLQNLKKYELYLKSKIIGYSALADWDDNVGKDVAAGQRSALSSARNELTSLFPELNEGIFTENH